MLREIKTDTELYFLDEFDRLQGEYKSFWTKGIQAVSIQYLDGIRHGEYKAWTESGKISRLSYHRRGQLHGELKHWHTNGLLREHSFYWENQRHGQFRYWNPIGKPSMDTFYQNDNNITRQIRAVVKDIDNINDLERLMIKLKFGIDIC